jgi:glyoxylase-like metal-dependent hydrolase (beta-lactamase superfamily II)/ferredoxin
VASLDRRLETNAPGDLYVDDSCIDCGACRWIAPATFDEAGPYSRVRRQPDRPDVRHRALMALVACPTASIGSVVREDVASAAKAYPDRLRDSVYHLGFHAESSFGAASYLIVRDGGNVMVDVPRYNGPLAKRIEALGGVRTMFFTHRDDVADHVRWAERFGAERILHAYDRSRRTKDVERFIEGEDEVELAPDLRIVPTPGHTRGSMCLLFDGVAFTGDHLAYRPAEGRVVAFRRTCWYDWSVQIASMKRLARHSFEWILPGHGAPVQLPAKEMADQMEACIAWMDEVC